LLYKAIGDKTEFNLSLQDIGELSQQTNCYYCGERLTIGTGHKHRLTDRTIDRKDNRRGYIKNNVAVACRRCNLMKGSWFTAEQTMEIARHYF